MAPSVRVILERSLAALRRDGVAGWWQRARRHLARHYRLRRDRGRHRRLHRSWYAQQDTKISIVIPSYNDHRLLERCLRRLIQTTDPRRTDIVISDDASPSPDHQAFLDGLRYPHVRVVRRRENGGFARAVNTGIQATAPDRDVILLNSDTEPLGGWLEALLYAASRHEEAGIVGARLLYPNWTIQSAGTFRNPIAPDWFDHYYRLQPAFFGPANVPSYVFAATGACMLIRRDVLASIGLLDERYSMAFEDVDLCLRAIRAGFRILYYPHAMLIHHESATRGRTVGARELTAKDLFWERWRDWFERRSVRNASGRPRIVYVVQESAPGRDVVIVEHVNRLRGLGYEAEIYALPGATEWPRLRAPFHAFADSDRLMGALASQEAIKVATCWKSAELVWLASLRSGIGAYYVHDAAGPARPTVDPEDDVALSRYRREFHYFTSSSWNCRRLREMNLDATNVGCGVDLQAFRVLPDARREMDVLLTPGLGDRDVDFELTRQSWTRLGAERPRLWAYGPEPALLAGAERTQYFAGTSPIEVNLLLNRATVFISTARHMAGAATILSAMAAGTPVICTDAGGNMDCCVNGHNCLVVKPDPASVAGAIRRLFSDAPLQSRLRAAGLETAARYGWDRVVADLAHFYESTDGQYSPTSRPREAAAG